MTTEERIDKVREIYELKEGAAIHLTDEEMETLHDLFVDTWNEGYDEGFEDGTRGHRW